MIGAVVFVCCFSVIEERMTDYLVSSVGIHVKHLVVLVIVWL